jgi:hypothetical protein
VGEEGGAAVTQRTHETVVVDRLHREFGHGHGHVERGSVPAYF